MAAPNTPRAAASTGTECLLGMAAAMRMHRAQTCDHSREIVAHPSGARRLLVEVIVDFLPGLGADSRRVFQIAHRSPLDRLQGSEVTQERALAHRADAGAFLQARFADVLLALLPMRADGEAMRLVAQALHEIQHRDTLRQLGRPPPRPGER